MTLKRRKAASLRAEALVLFAFMLGAFVLATPLAAQKSRPEGLDTRVQSFLDRSRGTWRDLNVPYEDGQVLHDLVVRNRFTRGLEIGTSTGHSAIWIAWAMSKTGGKLVTLEIDERRLSVARRNFDEAGVAPWVEARLGDAHDLVKQLPGPFDFVFSDADKDWYTQYFKDLEAKIAPGGCFTAHNVLDGFAGISAFLDHVRSRPGFVTTIDRTSRSGISITCRPSLSRSLPVGGLGAPQEAAQAKHRREVHHHEGVGQ
jgi:predicted O-methyltransferase YrrM